MKGPGVSYGNRVYTGGLPVSIAYGCGLWAYALIIGLRSEGLGSAAAPGNVPITRYNHKIWWSIIIIIMLNN